MSGENYKECSICLEKINKNIRKTKCNHEFHQKCLDKWIENNNTCPDCRYILSYGKIFKNLKDEIIDCSSSFVFSFLELFGIISLFNSFVLRASNINLNKSLNDNFKCMFSKK